MTNILSIAVLEWLITNSSKLPRDVNYRLYHVTHDSMPPIHLINDELIRYILFNSGFTKASELDGRGRPIVYESSDDEMLHNMRLMLGDF